MVMMLQGRHGQLGDENNDVISPALKQPEGRPDLTLHPLSYPCHLLVADSRWENNADS